MGSCNSKVENPSVYIPAPIPDTFDDWNSLSLGCLLRYHSFLQSRLDKPREKDDMRINTQYNVLDKHGAQIGQVCETIQTLHQVRADIKKRMGGILIEDDNYWRCLSFLFYNRLYLQMAIGNGELKPSLAMISINDIHTLFPELTSLESRTIIRFGLRVMEKSSNRDNNVLTEDALERWINKRHDGVGDSVFFHMFFRCVLPQWPRTEEARLSIPEFVQCVDRFCSFDDEQLLAFCFFCLCRIGISGGEIPFLALSSLSRIHPEIAFARKERGHPSKSFYDELGLRLEAIKSDKSKLATDLRLLKQKAYLTLECEKIAVPPKVTQQETTHDDNDQWGDAFDNIQIRNAPLLSTGIEDMMSLNEFAYMKEKSPFSVFDIFRIRDCLRKHILGVEFWKTREGKIKKGRSTAIPLFFGYDAQRQITPSRSSSETRSLSRKQVYVPVAVQYALQIDGSAKTILRTPKMDD